MISDATADAALRGLSSALLGLLENDVRPPCADGTDRWLDDSATVRAKVAPVCDDCEIRHRCRTFADTARPPITFGVWAGVDRTAANRKATA